MIFENAVTCKDIKKDFKNFSLNIPKLNIPRGCATALIGENGAGKSTLLNIMSGIRLDYKGEFRFFEEQDTIDNPDIKDMIGYTSSNNFFQPQWTVEQIADISELLFDSFDKNKYFEFCKLLNLPIDKKATVKSLSDGNKMKLELATAFCRDTKLLILDEPASPLDPLMRDKLCELICDYLNSDETEKSILFSTHNISDMESVTDYAVIMGNGCVLECGFVEELKEKYLIIKGDKEDLTNTPDLSNKIIGISHNRYGFEGLVEKEYFNSLNNKNIVSETPRLSQIAVSILKQYSNLGLR